MTRSVFMHRRARKLLSVDTFTRSGAIGSTDGHGILDPLAWTNQQATFLWQTNGSQAAVNGGPVGNAPVLATLPLLTADVDIAALVSNVPGNAGHVDGFVFRFTSTSDYLFAIKNNSGGCELWKRVSGTNTQLGTTATGSNVSDTLEVVAFGSTINVFRNGVLQIGPITETHNQTATLHGMYAINPNASGTIDDWTVSDA